MSANDTDFEGVLTDCGPWAIARECGAIFFGDICDV